MQTYVQVHVSQLLIASTSRTRERLSRRSTPWSRLISAWSRCWMGRGPVVKKLHQTRLWSWKWWAWAAWKKKSLARVGKYSYLFESKYGIIIWRDACQRRSDAWVIIVRNHLVETKLCHCHPLPLDWKKTRLNSTAVGEKSGGLRSTTAAASGRNPFVNRSIVEDIHLEHYYLESKNREFSRGICSKYTLRTPIKNIDIWRFGVDMFAILSLYIHIILYHIISYYIILYHIISYYIILYHIISYYIILYHMISYYIILYHITSYYIILYYIISYYIILYHIILYYIILYAILFYYITLYHIKLYYIMLFYYILLYYII